MGFVPKSVSNKFLAVVILVILISYLALSFSHFLISKVDSLDESIPLTGAFLISRGFIPHIDFWSMYPPLNYYLISFAFSWLGPSVVSARILQECLFTFFVICLYFGFKTFSGGSDPCPITIREKNIVPKIRIKFTADLNFSNFIFSTQNTKFILLAREFRTALSSRLTVRKPLFI